MPKQIKSKYVSDCCEAEILPQCADEGTCHAHCSKCGKDCNFKPAEIQPEKENWEIDSWCASIIAQTLTYNRINPNKDASHITRKLRNKIEEVLRLKKTEWERAERVEAIKVAIRMYGEISEEWRNYRGDKTFAEFFMDELETKNL